MFERFTDRARRVLVLSQEQARCLGHNFLGTEHILLGLMAENEGVAAKALQALDISLDAVRENVIQTIGMAGEMAASKGAPPFTPRAKKVLELSLREALAFGHNYIGTEHMLLGVIREGEGVGAQVLVALGADLEVVRRQVLELIGVAASQRGADEPTGRIRHVGSPALPVPTGEPPYCPRCATGLGDNLGYVTLPASSRTDDDASASVVVVYCRSCSFALGTAADPDQ